jgi:hypothetical protein
MNDFWKRNWQMTFAHKAALISFAVDAVCAGVLLLCAIAGIWGARGAVEQLAQTFALLGATSLLVTLGTCIAISDMSYSKRWQ